MNLAFEDQNKWRNFIDVKDKNKSTLTRHTPSPLVSRIVRESKRCNLDVNLIGIKDKGACIIAAGVNHDPFDWTGPPYTTTRYPNRNSIFDNLNGGYLKKLRRGKAILLLDQTLEGYQTTWLWKWFHDECARMMISPRAIIYVTGNAIAEEQYLKWANQNDITEQMKVVPYANFEPDIQLTAAVLRIEKNFDQLIEYKTKNIIKTFNCMNKRPRSHRMMFYLHLHKAGLVNDNMISMNDFEAPVFIKNQFTPEEYSSAKSVLPLKLYGEENNVLNDGYYINRVLEKLYKDSWVSVISEASYFADEHTVFISEKTFKPIACLHPFIILGSRGSLAKLRELGYKTFDGFIDESYDDLEDMDRFTAITKVLEDIKNIPDKLAWYTSMRDILEHNYDVLWNSKDKIIDAYNMLDDYCKGYFGVENGY
jgi:hypothetical protein